MKTIWPCQRELALAICMGMGLTACGGGGGTKNAAVGISPPTTPTTPTTPTPPTVPTVQPPVDIQLTATGAGAAHAAGFTGKGVAIGIVDSGVTSASPALAGKVTTTASFVDPKTNNLKVDDVLGHGTAVAEIAAGRPFGQFAGGVATDATIVSTRIVADKEPTDDGSGQGNKVTSADPLGAVNDAVIQGGARIVNNSWGGLYWDASDTATTDSFRQAYQRPLQRDMLYVFAAGNDGRANPSDVAALPSRVPELGAWIAVVALDSNNTSKIADYSNRCGIAAAYCVAAPGAVITLASTASASNPSYQIWTGTSLAAPQVSGAAAVLASEYPHFSMYSIQQLILGTADDLGDPGVDAIYGNGRLNLGRAIFGPGRIDNGDFRANIGSDNVVFSNDISGSDGLRVEGSGRLTLTGKNTFGGTLFLQDTATVDVKGDIPHGVYINTGATVIPHGKIGGGMGANGLVDSVEMNGTLQLLPQATTIDGEMHMYGPSRLSVYLGAPLTVTRTAYLGGDLYIAGAISGYTGVQSQTIVHAMRIDGTFATTTKAPGVFLTSSVSYTATDVNLDTRGLSVTATANASPVISSSPAAMASAPRVDAAFQQINQALASPGNEGAVPPSGTLVAAGQIQQSRNEAVAQASLASLSGQVYAANTAVTLAGIDAGNDAFIQHLDQRGPTGAWTQSLGERAGLSGGGYSSVGVSLAGQVIGQDIRVGASGFVGASISRLDSNGQLSGGFDRQRSRSTETSLYAGSRGDHWYGVGRIGFGSFRGDTQRALRFGDDIAFAGGDNNGRYQTAYGELGYRTFAGSFTLTPFANVAYSTIRRDGFQESGGDGFGLTALGHTTSRWQAGVGLRAGSEWLTSAGRLRLDAKLGWQNAFATKGEVFAARFNGFSQWAPVEGIGLSRRAATAGLNLAWDVSATTQFGMSVDQRFADHDHSRSANVSYRLAW